MKDRKPSFWPLAPAGNDARDWFRHDLGGARRLALARRSMVPAGGRTECRSSGNNLVVRTDGTPLILRHAAKQLSHARLTAT